jgi:hypothetical protein
MLDRVELFTNRYLISERNFASIRKYTSKLLEEDEDIKELKRTDMNALYKNLFIESTIGNKLTGETYDDPVSFYIFAVPRFHRLERDKYKIVFNPSNVSCSKVESFLYRNFSSGGKLSSRVFFDSFRLGRVDFAFDVESHTVTELFHSVWVESKARKHVAVYEMEENQNYVRTIGDKNLETFYIGKGTYTLRCYDKVKESKYQIAVKKREGLPVPEKLLKRSQKKVLTRIEMQIRNLGLLGYVENEDHQKIFQPSRRHQELRTFYDLLNMRSDQMDVFSNVHFSDAIAIDLFEREEWKQRAFLALVREVGFDNAVKLLSPDTRRRLKKKISTKSFSYNLDKNIFGEIQQWRET